MKINFFGTDIFASIVLKSLIEAGFDIVSVITKPDSLVGRKKELSESRIAILAKDLGIKNILKPSKLKEFESELSKFNADINVVCEYGKIIPDSVLNLPKFKSINIHGSILPKYRGASPIQFALMNGDKETGVTLMEMDDQMDHGNIISIEKCVIENNDIEQILREKLAIIGASLLIKELKYLKENNKFSNSIVQNHDEATYTKLIEKNDGFIDFITTNSFSFVNKFRAFSKWPGVFIVYKDKRVKITDISFDLFDFNDESNVISPFFVDNKSLYLKFSDNKFVKINKLQFEGKNEISDKDFINQIKSNK